MMWLPGVVGASKAPNEGSCQWTVADKLKDIIHQITLASEKQDPTEPLKQITYST
jgi:hypothetical protein